MSTTFRSDVAAGLYGLLTGFQTANPTSLNNAYRARPASMRDRPLGFVNARSETMVHDAGTRTRTMIPTVVLVWAMTDDGEQADVRDDVIDAFLDYATARPRAVTTTTITQPTTVEDVELELDGAFYPASVVTFSAVIQEGRL